MDNHDKDSYDVTTNLVLSVKEKLDNISIRFKLWKIPPLIRLAVIIIIAAAVVLLAASAFQKKPDFSYPCESGFEKRYVTMTKNKLKVSMRISDIRVYYNTDPNETYSSLEYDSDSDDILIIADLIFTNNGKEDLSLSSTDADFALGYAKDIKYEPDGTYDAYIVRGEMYSDESGKYEYAYSLNIAPGETVEKRFSFRYPAVLADKINTLYLCDKWENDYDEETVYDIMGLGKPYLTFHLSNRKLFPRLTRI